MKKQKAQVSVEMLIIVGIVVLGAIIFGVYYLSSINKNIDTASNIDSDLSNKINYEEMGSSTQIGGGVIPGGGGGGNLVSLCGNNIIDTGEECDGTNIPYASCNAYNSSYNSGTLSCFAPGTRNECKINHNNCSTVNFGTQCGDGILQSFPQEQCDVVGSDGFGSLQYNHADCNAYYSSVYGEDNWTGSLGCNVANCVYNLNNCVENTAPPVLAPFQVLLTPNNYSNVAIMENRNINFQVTNFGDYNNISLNVYVKNFNNLFFLNNCFYNDTQIPANINGLYISNLTSAQSSVAGQIKCNQAGLYNVYFRANQLNETKTEKLVFSVISSTPLEDVSNVFISPSQGEYYNTISVSLSTTTPDATIYYTLDGSDPDPTKSVYTGQFNIAGGYGSNSSLTLKARAYKEGYNPSQIANRIYSFRVADISTNITFDTPYLNPQQVSLSTVTNNSTIYYTLNGDYPYHNTGILYTSPFIVSDFTGELRVMAYKPNYQDSSELSGNYFINSYCNDVNVPLYVSNHSGLFTYNRDVVLSSSACQGNFYEPSAIEFLNPRIDGNHFKPNSSNLAESLFCENHGGTFVSKELSSESGFTRYEADNLLIPNPNPPPPNYYSPNPLWGYSFGSTNVFKHSKIVCDFTQ